MDADGGGDDIELEDGGVVVCALSVPPMMASLSRVLADRVETATAALVAEPVILRVVLSSP